MPQSSSTGKASHQKEKIPIEIKNAREWDPNRNKIHYPSEDESEDDCFDDEEDDFIHTPYVSGGKPSNEQAAKDPPDITKTSTRIVPTINAGNGVTQKELQPVIGRTTSKLPTQPRKIAAIQDQIRRKLHLNYRKDNFARVAFRKRLPHTDIFRLHKDCHEIFPNQRKMYDILEEMGIRNGSFIRPPQHVKDRELLIWGSHVQVKKTMVDLHNWLRAERPSGVKKEMFARETSTIGGSWNHLQKQMMKQAAIQRFQQVPEEGRVFRHDGAFLWPVEEVKPEDLLGTSLEAFDPLRFQYKCHIVFDNRLSAFKIFTDEPQTVTKIMSRIAGVMKEYTARNSRRIVEYVVEPPSLSVMRKDVKTLPGPTVGLTKSTSKIPRLTGDTLEIDTHNSWLEAAEGMSLQNSGRIELDLRKAIPILPYYRGQLRMRIHFGTFALTVLRWPEKTSSMPFEEFMTNMALPGTKGTILKDLQIEQDAATIMQKVYRATDLFEPLSNSTFKLERVAPSFGACFMFQEQNEPTVQLQVEMGASSLDDAMYEKSQVLWTRADRRDNSTLLSIFKVQLDGGSSWKLHVSTEYPVDTSRITPKKKDFADSIKLNKVPTTGFKPTGHKMFQWQKDLPGALRPMSFEQKTSFKFRLVDNTDFVFEIARYDVYGDPNDENLPIYTSWAATLWNTDWDATLAENSDLGIGQSASWSPELARFFPGHGASTDEGLSPGVTKFLSTMQKVTDFVDDLKGKPSHL